MKPRINQLIEILEKDLTDLVNQLEEIEDASEYDDNKSVDDMEKAIHNIKFIVPSINGGIIVLREAVSQYIQEKSLNKKRK